MKRQTAWIALGVAMTACAAAGPAAAAPQMLALMATPEPTALNCADGVCAAEFSAYCLQERRRSPTEGTAYRPAPDTRLTLSVNGADGSVRELDARPYVTIESSRIYVSVRISLPQEKLREWGATGAALKVAPLASLVPVAAANDPDPITPAEVAAVTRDGRALAERVSQGDDGAAAEARAYNKLINANVANGDAVYTVKIDRDALWAQAIGGAPGPGAEPGMARAAETLASCHTNYGGYGASVTECLKSFHDSLMSTNSNRVWRAMDAGS